MTKFFMRIVKWMARRYPREFAEALNELPETRDLIVRQLGARFVLKAERKNT